MTTPSERYDSLLQCYAEWDRWPQTAQWFRRVTPLDWTLMKRIVEAESNYNPDARSPVGALGLAQFMRPTWDEWAQEQRPNVLVHLHPQDPEDAVWALADYLAWLLGRWRGDVPLALASYNWGIGNVRRVHQALGDEWREGLPLETLRYIKKILNNSRVV